MSFTGADLRELRRRHNASIAGMAPLLGVHRNTWAKIEAASEEDVPKTLCLALAAWTRGIPAIGEERGWK